MKSGREVMKGEMEGKWKIAGTAIAVIIVASVFMVMMPMACARKPDGNITDGDVLFIGEHGLHFDPSVIAPNTPCKLQKVEDSTVVETIVISNSSDFYIPDDVEEDGYRVINQSGAWVANVTIKKPKITADIYIEGTTNSIVGETVPVGTNITIRVMPNFGGLMNASKPGYQGNWSRVKIILTPPPGKGAPREFVVNATKSEIDVGPDSTKNDVVWSFLDTENWDTGEWTVKIKAIPEYCNEVNVKSDEYKFTVRSEKLTIEAEKTTVGRGEKILLTVSGNPNAYYYFVIENVKSGEEPQIQDTADIEARGGANNTKAWIKTGSDGVATIEINTTNADERTYTMHVFGRFNTTCAGCGGAWPNTSCFPDADKVDRCDPEDDDEVDVKVEAPKVTFDIPASVVIGEKLKIKGSISAGTYVDVVIRDKEIVANDEPVDENKEFEVEWDTSDYMPGSYTIDVYIDLIGVQTMDQYEEEDEDGSTVIRLVAPGLTAEQLRNVIAEGDDYSFEGTATGVDEVDYVLIGPKGTRTGNVNDVTEGLLIDSTSVSDNLFSEDVEMTEGLDTGVWICMILTPGRDGIYGNLRPSGYEKDQAGHLAEVLAASGIDFSGKSQDQIKAMILDKTVNAAGSDDLLKTFTFKVESAYVRFNPVESVMVGEPLNISGVTNREPGTTITISTFAGPTILDTVLAEVEWPTPDEGVFSATIDTTGAEPGTYTFEADDGDGHTDTITVEISAAVPSPTPSPSPTVSPTPTPTPSPTPTPTASPVAPTTPTPTPSPSPSPTPGFEALFAVAGLLAITYFVLRRKK